MELRETTYPKEWQEIQIGELCKTFTKQTGFDYSNHIKPTLVKKKTDKVVPFIQNKDFDGIGINYNTDYYIPFEIAKRFPMILLDEKCLLISISGSIGKVGVFNNRNTAFIGGAVAVGKFNNPDYLDWIKHFLLSDAGQYILLSKVKAGSHQNLILDDIRKIKIPLPSFPEQNVIAKVLTDTDQLIQNLKTLIAKKKAIKQGAMQELLTGKKRLKGFSEKWTTKSLENVTENLVRGPFGGALKKEFFVKKGYKVYEQKNAIYKSTSLGKYYIDEDKFKELKRFELKPRDFIVSCSGTIGKIFQLPNKFEKGIINQALLKITLHNFIIDDDYFYYQFISKPFQSKIIDDIQGGAMKNLVGMSVFKETEIEMPSSIDEQIAIAQILSDMDSEIEVLETQLQKTENIKQGMMQELLTGKIRLVDSKSQSIKKDLSAKIQSKSETKAIPLAAEPEIAYKTEKPRNEHITDAVLIGTMADAFGSDKFPLTRFMYTKVSYLVKRFKEEEDNGYLKKAAGPYKPKTKYGGAEKIALENKYVKKHISNYKGKKYENFVAGENATKAVEYFKKWYGHNALQWIQQFKYTKRNQLELWATVDMAMQDLLLENKIVNFRAVKQLINDDKEWRPKLKRPTFSDDNLKSAIVKLNQLFR